MNRLNRAVAALTVCGGLLVAAPLFAQDKPAGQPLKPVLTGKFVPPVRGTAEVQYLKPKVDRKGKQVITTIQVKNVSTAPIAGLRCVETWYSKQSSLVPGGGTWRAKGLIQPGEIVTFQLIDDVNPEFYQNQYQFTHGNGNVKAKPVPRF